MQIDIEKEVTRKTKQEYWTDKLKNCPFCGGRAKMELSSRGFIGGKSTKITYAYCTKCGARSTKHDTHELELPHNTRELVVKEWNLRTDKTISEQVNHPSHYKKEGHKECIEEMEDLFGTFITAIFCLTNAFKYLYRAGGKDGQPEERDINKARWYYNWVEEKNAIKPIPSIINPTIKLSRYIKKELAKYDKD